MLDVRNSCGVGVERILLPTSERKKGNGGEEERRGMSENHITRTEKRRKRERVCECCGNGGGCTLSWCLLSSSLVLCSPCRSLAASMDDDSPGTGEPKDPANQTETVTMLGPERRPPSLFLSHSLLGHTYPSLGMDVHIRLKP
jgi:hypothetical protein